MPSGVGNRCQGERSRAVPCPSHTQEAVEQLQPPMAPKGEPMWGCVSSNQAGSLSFRSPRQPASFAESPPIWPAHWRLALEAKNGGVPKGGASAAISLVARPVRCDPRRLQRAELHGESGAGGGQLPMHLHPEFSRTREGHVDPIN
jgi:hypothetical protein